MSNRIFLLDVDTLVFERVTPELSGNNPQDLLEVQELYDDEPSMFVVTERQMRAFVDDAAIRREPIVVFCAGEDYPFFTPRNAPGFTSEHDPLELVDVFTDALDSL